MMLIILSAISLLLMADFWQPSMEDSREADTERLEERVSEHETALKENALIDYALKSKGNMSRILSYLADSEIGRIYEETHME